ncbi:MAG: hypothetical protein D6807_06045 [Alphaproteobacteria bacterium]|nr:MAG: hypothetical protein D6807_06045 [Alphaproteobacteria bacterium]
MKKIRNTAALAFDGLFGPRFDYFDLLRSMGRVPEDLDRYVDYDLVIRKPAQTGAAVARAA